MIFQEIVLQYAIEIDVNLLESISPAIILDKTDDNLFFVLMPMRI